ncbi:rhodanese-like domain-containing protein [Brevundimonas sp. Root1279]|uniref:rhodanese-like domain-containing protein n=1 Tax=Brevundimonas sp. Root1279 TaxID=1736443 RepID=UPI0006F66C17|nr:rhodanese-like domain-containing protein [Brevundimonas sp. Root1279]KQW86710.1 rhodanese [Brevundimonas sp. Root1279]
MPESVKSFLEAANAAVPRISVDEARSLVAERDALLLDVRDPAEIAASGKLAGAVNVPRGMLEFRADPDAPAHLADLRKDRPVVVYCASGGRSALAGQTLQAMGYGEVLNLGGFKDASAAGYEVETAQ